MKENLDFQFLKPGAIRTRYAPAPTGSLHIGSARTALFNYLFAKKNQGSFILRIEDTDISRNESIFEKEILETLKWLGIEWDEGPDNGGSFGPYRQSERLEIYKKYLKKLLDENKAYYCFCTEEELDAQRQEQMSRGEAPKYSGTCANFAPEEIKKNLGEKKKYIIRFRVYPQKIIVNDLIRGVIEFDTTLIGDFPIAKFLEYPLYNFSVAVDDIEMKISHVIRGEDLLPNTPKQILIQEALFLHSREEKLSLPSWVHLPLILGSDRSKLSKRREATAVSDYKKDGYLSEAIINFISFLGWNPGTNREIYSLASLVKEFSLEKIQKSGAVFNLKRLDFLNGFYIRQRSIEKLTDLCLPYLIKSKFISIDSKKRYIINEMKEIISFNYLEKIISIYQERLKKLSEIVELTDFFFKDKLEYAKELLKWRQMKDEDVILSLNRLEIVLSKIQEEDWHKDNLQRILLAEAEKNSNRGELLWPLRVAMTGKENSAGPFEIAEILGKEKVLKRMQEAKCLI
ncbi:MAG: glutamate--tRNA ligase [Patescibacteria group bacterium]